MTNEEMATMIADQCKPCTSDFYSGIKQGVLVALNAHRWIPVDEKEPKCDIIEEGIHYSKYLEIKVKGYDHPFIGYYVLANDDQFFDFIHKSMQDEIRQTDITHYRFVV